MSILIDVKRRTPGRVVTIMFVGISMAVGLIAAVVVTSLAGRVERLESDLSTARLKIDELTASLSRLSANVETADR